MSADLLQDYNFNKFDISYDTEQAISSSASNLFIPLNSVVVAHSQGGLLTREYLRQNNTQSIRSLITVGTPHFGAPIIHNIQEGILPDLTNLWIDDLAAGPKILLGENSGLAKALDILDEIGIIGATGLTMYLSNRFNSTPALSDMKGATSFLNTLNAVPNNTLPASRYAIFGAEHDYGYVRIADSGNRKAQSGYPMESGIGIGLHQFFVNVYFGTAIGSAMAAYHYGNLYNNSDYNDPFHFYYYDQYILYATAAEAFFHGYLSLKIYQHIEYEQYVVGASRSGNQIEYSDALLPATTQAPEFFGSYGSNILKAEGANHLELTAHPNSKTRLEFAFNNIGIPINNNTPTQLTTPSIFSSINNDHPI